MKRATAVAFVAAAVALAFAAAQGLSASQPVTIRGFGLWTLQKLGYPDEVRHGTASDLKRPMIYFALPPRASQGPQNWYVLRLHLRLTLAPDSGPGTIDVSATTDQATCALISFRVGVARRVDWTGVGIVDGVTRGSSRTGTAELRYANYLQRSGVKAGRNDLDFQLAQHGKVHVAELRIFDDSGIEYTPLAPANVRLDAHVAPTVRVGRTIVVRFVLRNVGERAARNIRVAASYPRARLTLVATHGARVSALRQNRSTSGSFVFRARKTGKAPVFVAAQTSSNRPGDSVAVVVRR